jgi:hypothetical protein
MAYEAPPARTGLADTYPNPTNAQFKAAIGDLWDYLTNLLGLSGNPEGAFDAMKLIDSNGIWNLRPTFSVGSNALTITVKGNDNADLSANNPGYVHQRHTTLTDSTLNRRKVTANLALTISSGSTLGHTSAQQGLIYGYYIENGSGAIELAVSSYYYGMSGILGTTAEGGAGGADTATIIYSATARSLVPYRLAWIARSTQTTAGTWAALPSEIIYPPFNFDFNLGNYPNTIQVLTDAPTIDWNIAEKGRKVQVTLAGNRTMATPIGLVDGMELWCWVINDATPGRTMAFSADWFFPGGIDHITTGTNGSIDLLHGIVRLGKIHSSWGADMKN